MRDQLDVMTPAGGEGSYQNCVPAPHPSPSPDANNCGPLPVFGGFFTESWYINNKYVSLLQERGGQGDLSSFSSNIDICIRICHCKFIIVSLCAVALVPLTCSVKIVPMVRAVSSIGFCCSWVGLFPIFDPQKSANFETSENIKKMLKSRPKD